MHIIDQTLPVLHTKGSAKSATPQLRKYLNHQQAACINYCASDLIDAADKLLAIYILSHAVCSSGRESKNTST